jgi:prephenate dehydratase
VPDNRTRFVVVTRAEEAGTAPATPALFGMRTTLAMALPNEPGALHRVLGILAEARINMSKLESRPLHGRTWEYVFWVDLDCGAEEPGARDALAAVEASVPMLRILGSYPRSEA